MGNFGLCDGEGVERLWSFLRRFSTITKEMTPAHRESLLNEALSYYQQRKIDALGGVSLFYVHHILSFILLFAH